MIWWKQQKIEIAYKTRGLVKGIVSYIYMKGDAMRVRLVSRGEDAEGVFEWYEEVPQNRHEGVDGVLGSDYTICAGRDEPSSSISRSKGSK